VTLDVEYRKLHEKVLNLFFANVSEVHKRESLNVTQLSFILSIFLELGYKECKKIFSISTLFSHVCILAIFDGTPNELKELSNQIFNEWSSKIWADDPVEVYDEMTNWIKSCLSQSPADKPAR
jgi:hypothetical protein